MKENELVVTVDFTKGNYLLELFSPTKKVLKSFSFPIRGRDNVFRVMRENYKATTINNRRKELRRQYNFSRRTTKKIDTTLFKALEEFDKLMPATSFMHSYLNGFAKYDVTPKMIGEDREFFESRVASDVYESLINSGIRIIYNAPFLNASRSMTFMDKIRGRRIALNQERYTKAPVNASFFDDQGKFLEENYPINDFEDVPVDRHKDLDADDLDFEEVIIESAKKANEQREASYLTDEELAEISRIVSEVFAENKRAREAALKAESEKEEAIISSDTSLEIEVPDPEEVVDAVEDNYDELIAVFRNGIKNSRERRNDGKKTTPSLVMPDFLKSSSIEEVGETSSSKEIPGLVMPDFLKESRSEGEEIIENEVPEPESFHISDRSRMLWRNLMNIVNSGNEAKAPISTPIENADTSSTKARLERNLMEADAVLAEEKPKVKTIKDSAKGRVRPTRRQRIQAAKKAARSETSMERNARLKREKEERNKNRVPLTPEEIAARKEKKYKAIQAKKAEELAAKAAKRKTRSEKARIAREKYQEKLRKEQEEKEKLNALKQEDSILQSTIDGAVGSLAIAVLERKEAEDLVKKAEEKRRIEAVRGYLRREKTITGRIANTKKDEKKPIKTFDNFKRKFTRKLQKGMKRIKDMKFKPSAKTKGRIIKGVVGAALIALLFTGSSKIVQNINNNTDKSGASVATVIMDEDETDRESSDINIILDNAAALNQNETELSDNIAETEESAILLESENIETEVDDTEVVDVIETEAQEETLTEITGEEENVVSETNPIEIEPLETIIVGESDKQAEDISLSPQEIVDNLQIGSSIEIEEGAYWEAPEETGRHGYFENHTDHGLVVTYIDISTPDGMVTIKNAGKTIAELRKEYMDKGYSADQIQFSVHFEDNEGHVLGWVKDGSLVTNIENQNLDQEDNQR